MGFAAGDSVPWTRWWVRADAGLPILANGFLDDPAGPYAEYKSIGATTLADHQSDRVVVLLGEPGIGKTHELRREAARRRGLGHDAEIIELGSMLSATDLRDAIDEAVSGWSDREHAPPALILDGFDEPSFTLHQLSNALRRALESVPMCTQIVVASRRSLWSDAIERSMPSWAPAPVKLALAPLTESQARSAVATDLPDVDAFMGQVFASGVGWLAAHPITLRFLLRAAQKSELASTRVGLYQLGVEGLAEGHDRAGSGDPPLDARLTAAARLAAATLLSGQPHVFRRRRPGQSRQQVSLDAVTSETTSRDALEAVFDSALLEGDGDARSWMHRSIEEYLCAQRLGALPLDAVANLLADPTDSARLRPQLAGVAAWLAWLNDVWFDWVLQRRFEVLLNPDLRSRPDEQRRRLARVLVASIASDEMPYDVLARRESGGDSIDYRGLGYDGISDDLAPLLKPDQPWWRQREALVVVIDNGLRCLDGPLLELVEHAARDRDVGDYDGEVQSAVYAAIGLRGCTEADLVGRAKLVAANQSAPWTVRIELIRWLWPRHMSTGELSTAVSAADRLLGDSAFGRKLDHLVLDAVRSYDATPAQVLPLIASSGEIEWDHRRPRSLIATVLWKIIANEEPGSSTWSDATTLALHQLRQGTDVLDLSGRDVDDARRRQFVRDTIMGQEDGVAARRLIACGGIRTDDLPWWLAELARSTAEDSPGMISARAAIQQLVNSVLEETVLTEIARATTTVLDDYPSLQPFVSELFGQPAQTQRATAREAAERTLRAQQARAKQEKLSIERLERALAEADFEAVVDEIRRESYGSLELNAWPMLNADHRQSVAAAAVGYLQRGDVNAALFDVQDRLIIAHKILTAHDSSALASVPAERWLSLLPHLLVAPGTNGITRTALARAAAANAHATDEVIVAALQNPVAVRMLRDHVSEPLSRAALALADRDDVDVGALPSLLMIIEKSLPEEAAAAAISHVHRRPLPAAGSDRSQSLVFRHAVTAAAVLLRMSSLSTVFEQLLDAFRRDTDLAEHAVRGAGRDIRLKLSARQMSEMFLWARATWPTSRWPAPGVVYSSNLTEEFADTVLAQLTDVTYADDQSATDTATALEQLAVTTGDVWIRRRARIARDTLRGSAPPPGLTAILAVIDNPTLLIVTTAEQLADAVLKALDELAIELSDDRALRAQLWHRQRRDNAWVSHVPLAETELSDWLRLDLERRLPRVALLREVQIQPRLSKTGSDIPDLLAVALTTIGTAISLVIEVKANWHRDATTAIDHQLAKRYLAGPHGRIGVYIVGCYRGNAWDAADSRRAATSHRGRDAVTVELERRGRALVAEGVTTHFRVLDLWLDDDQL